MNATQSIKMSEIMAEKPKIDYSDNPYLKENCFSRPSTAAGSEGKKLLSDYMSVLDKFL
jgi:hypothetical protein